MKTAVSLVLLLAGLSAGAVGVGYLVRRHGSAPAAGPAPAPSTQPVTPPTTIAIGEPNPAAPGFVLAGSQAGGTTVISPLPSGSGQMWAGGTPPWIFDETRPTLPLQPQPVVSSFMDPAQLALLEQLKQAATQMLVTSPWPLASAPLPMPSVLDPRLQYAGGSPGFDERGTLMLA